MIRSTIAFLFMAVVLGLAAAADQAAAPGIGPLSMDDIRQLRRDGRVPKDIVEVAQQRGIDFDIDAKTERTLRGMGFRRSMVERIKKSRATIPTDAPTPEPSDSDKPATDRPDQNKADNKPKDDQKRAAGNAEAEAYHKAFVTRVQRIRAASGLNLAVTPSTNVTLVADQSTTTKYLPTIKKIEALIRKTFPAPLGTGPDRRSTFIVLLRNESDYERWIRATFTIYAREGAQGYTPATLQAALRAAASLPRGMSIMNLRKTGPGTTRSIAFNTGLLYMQGVTGNKAPAALLTGFGNTTEAIFAGSPQSMLGIVDYADAHLPQASGNRWMAIVQRQFASGKLTSVEQLYTYGIGGLEEQHYAEAWSLTNLLVSDRLRFARLVAEVRDGKRVPAAIESAFGLNDEQLRQAWARHVGFRPEE